MNPAHVPPSAAELAEWRRMLDGQFMSAFAVAAGESLLAEAQAAASLRHDIEQAFIAWNAESSGLNDEVLHLRAKLAAVAAFASKLEEVSKSGCLPNAKLSWEVVAVRADAARAGATAAELRAILAGEGRTDG